MKNIILFLILFFSALLSFSQCNRFDIILLTDLSGSTDVNRNFIKKAYHSFTNKFNVNQNEVRISIIGFATEAKIFVNLNSSENNRLNDVIDSLNIYDLNYLTNMLGGLRLARKEMINNGRVDVKKIIVIVSDGADNSGEESKIFDLIYTSTHLDNIEYCGILIENRASNYYFIKKITSQYCYFISDYSSLENTLININLCF